ncbi:MAG: hypothetical protein KDJ65_31915 [Anaerolineae bacterium]|nr:hypothetical protein [Anaerolineae bacterium]
MQTKPYYLTRPGKQIADPKPIIKAAIIPKIKTIKHPLSVLPSSLKLSFMHNNRLSCIPVLTHSITPKATVIINEQNKVKNKKYRQPLLTKASNILTSTVQGCQQYNASNWM